MLVIKSASKDLAPVRLVGVNRIGSATILTGKRKKPDTLSFSAFKAAGPSDYVVAVQGLYRGSYADGKVLASDLIAGLEAIGAEKDLNSLKRAFAAWIS